MNIQIKTTGFPHSEAVSEYIQKKVQTLEKFLEPDSIVHVEVAKTTHHHQHGDIFRAELRVFTHGKDVYVTEETADVYASIDKVKDEAHRRLSQNKEKAVTFVRRGGAKVKALLKGFFNK